VTAARRALLVDLDGVLRDWSACEAAVLEREQAYGLPPGSLLRTAFEPARLMPALTGEVGDEQWRLGVARVLAAQVGTEKAVDLVTTWGESAGVVDAETLASVSALRAHGVPVVLVTNATTRLEFDLVRLDLHDTFDAVASSARLGVVKPGAGIYLAAAAMAGVEAEECVFVDDSAANVAGAERLGMAGVVFSGPPSIAVARDILAVG